REVAAGRISPDKVNEKLFARYLDEPSMPDVDLFVRSSGEQRISNFLLWQSAYAELVFVDTLWPDFDRRHLWQAVEQYAAPAMRPRPTSHDVTAEPTPRRRAAGATATPARYSERPARSSASTEYAV